MDASSLPLDLGFTKVLLIIEKRKYTVVDPNLPDESMYLIEIVKDNEQVTVWDVRSGNRTVIETWNLRSYRMVLAEKVMQILEGFVCETCKNGWGPVCCECAEKVADELFFMYKEMLKEGRE